MRRMTLAISCIVVVFASALQGVHAERWLQASPTDPRVWYDADNVRPTGDHLVGVWISTGPNRTNPGTDGAKSYPTFSVIDCRKRTAGSKLSLDSGQALETYTSDSAMGELIEKLCS